MWESSAGQIVSPTSGPNFIFYFRLSTKALKCRPCSWYPTQQALGTTNPQALAVPLPATQPSCSLQQDWWCWANRQLPKELVSRAALLQEQLRENWIFHLNTQDK